VSVPLGFYFRKSRNIGPVRFNFSKSGVGVSVGRRGFRVGLNAQGKRYIHAGANGLYYRGSLDSPAPPPATEASRIVANDVPPSYPNSAPPEYLSLGSKRGGSQHSQIFMLALVSQLIRKPLAGLCFLLLLLVVPISILNSVFRGNDSRSPSHPSPYTAPIPQIAVPLAQQRANAINSLKQAADEKTMMARYRKSCRAAIAKDSGFPWQNRFAMKPGEDFYPMTYYFTITDPQDRRLFLSFHYKCDPSSGTPMLSEVKKDVYPYTRR